MRSRIITVVALIVAASIGLSGVVLAGRPRPAGYPGPEYLAGADRMPTPAAIAFFAERVTSTHDDPLTLTTLGQLQLTRYRETGDVTHLDHAEQALEQALTKQSDHPAALLTLGAVSHARHQFAETLDLARRAHAAEPSAESLSLIGDALSALGDYDAAEEHYRQAVASRAEAALPGLALIAEVRGRPDEAKRLLQQAAADSLDRRLVGEPAAWYQLRLGGLLLEHGQLDEAEDRFEAALFLFPASTDALEGLADVAAARGDYEHAIELLESLEGPGAGVLVTLGDLYAISGRPGLAESRYTAAEAAMLADAPEIAGRDLAMFYADHDRRPLEALRLAREDFERRRDLHGYEAMAWALYRAERYEEAQRFSDEALGFGVVDAPLRYHAGLIALALGDVERARAELRTALDVNPDWHVLHADHARRLLEDLG